MQRGYWKTSVAALFGILWSGALFAQCPDTVWTKTYGVEGHQNVAYSVRQTTDGGYILAGHTGWRGCEWMCSDFYLVKTDADGDTLWTRAYERPGYDEAYSVEQTSDGGYVIAGVNAVSSDCSYYLLKTDANGDTVWTRTSGGTECDGAHSVQQTTDGGYIIAGFTGSFGAGGRDMYLVKTDEHGDTAWTRTYGGPDWDDAYSVKQTTDGGYVIVGWTGCWSAGGCHMYVVKTDGSGDTLWTRTFGGGGYSVQQTAEGGYIIAGETSEWGEGGGDVYLIKLDAYGDTLWTRTYGVGEGTSEYGFSVQQTGDGGYIVVGGTEDSLGTASRFYVVKTDGGGDTLWTMTCDSGESYGSSVRQTFDGGYIAAGFTYPFGSSDLKIYLIKIDDTCSRVPAVVDFDPDVLNSQGRGRWVTCYIELPQGYAPEDIDVSTLLINETVPAEEHPTDVGDYDGDGMHDRMVKFSRSGVIGVLLRGDSVEVRVSGRVADEWFGGADTIRVLMPRITYAQGIIDYDEGDGAIMLCSGAGAPGVCDLPSTFALHACSPNPFAVSTVIRFDLPEATSVNIKVFDIEGREVAVLADGEWQSGSQSLDWDGEDKGGTRLSPGIYFLRMEARGFVDTKKLMLLR